MESYEGGPGNGRTHRRFPRSLLCCRDLVGKGAARLVCRYCTILAIRLRVDREFLSHQAINKHYRGAVACLVKTKYQIVPTVLL